MVVCASEQGPHLSVSFSPEPPQDPVVLQYQLITQLLQRIPPDALDAITVVGGQAMLFWALRYAYAEESPFQMSHNEKVAVASSDLDFFAKDRKAIESCASGWNGEVWYPSMDDQTPNTAVVHVDIGTKEPYGIDFLGSLKGLPERAIEQLWDTFLINGEEIRFLSPPLCLASRIHNYRGLGYGPDKLQREAQRIGIAIRLTNRYISENLDNYILFGRELGHKRPDTSLGVLRFLNQLLVHSDTTDVVMETGLNPMEAIPRDHAGWPVMTCQKHIPGILQKAETHYRRKARHKRSHLKPGRAIPPGMARWLDGPP